MHRYLPVLLALTACGPRQGPADAAGQEATARLDQRRPERDRVDPWATFEEHRPTGVAVAEDGRVFVNFPNWEEGHDLSVAQVLPSGTLLPYPDPEWNHWEAGERTLVGNHFVSVQSVWADDHHGLWILDAGAPGMGSVIQGAPKLVQVDLRTDRIVAVYGLDGVVRPKSNLEDVRVDLDRRVAYMTDSGTGALVVLDLDRRDARRVLGNDPSTKAEDIIVNVDGRAIRDSRSGNEPLRINVNGIALDEQNRYLYFHPLTGLTLYRIDTRVLSDGDRTRAEIRDAVEPVARTVVTDGLEIDDRGRILHTALEMNAIVAYDPSNGRLEKVAQDQRLSWPASIAVGEDGDLFVATSRMDEMARFNNGHDVRTEPFGIYRIPPPPGVSRR